MADQGAVQLNSFNQHWRSSPVYAEIMRELGANTSGPMRLSDSQRRRAVVMARARGAEIPDGLEIDPAGNWNQNEGFGKQLKRWGPVAAAAALTAFGIPGVMPGLLTGSGGAAAAAGSAGASGVIPASHIPTAWAMNAVPGAIASQAASVGVPSVLAAIGGAEGGRNVLSRLWDTVNGDGEGGDWTDILSGIGDITTRAAQGSHDQRMAEAMMAVGFGNQALTGARDRFDADLRGEQSRFNSDLAGSNAQFGAGMDSATFDREGQTREQRQQALMTMLGNTKDAKLTPGNPAIAAAMGTREGGARPSNLTNNSDSLLALLGKSQIAAPTYQAPDKFKPPTPYESPELPSMPEGSALEDILGGVGLGTDILSVIGGGSRTGRTFRPNAASGYQDPYGQGGRPVRGAQY